MAGGGDMLRPLAYLGPWRKVLWAARRGNGQRFVRACLARLTDLVAQELQSFASHNAGLAAIEWHHAVACLDEMIALREADPTFMLHMLTLHDGSRQSVQASIHYIEWLAHRVACVVYVARRPLHIGGRRFVPPHYVLPVHNQATA